MLHRFIPLQGAAMTRLAQGGDLVVDMAFSSELPYERWWGVEILDHSDGAIDLTRLNDGASVFFNHDPNELRGVHVRGSVATGADKVLRGKVQLTSVTQAGRDAIGLVESGTLSKASIGYQIDKVIEQSTTKDGRKLERELDGALFERTLTRHRAENRGDLVAFRRDLDAAAGAFERGSDDPTIYRVVKWTPYENSLVTIPADPTVGVGRSVVRVEATKETTKETTSVEQIQESGAAVAASSTAKPAITQGARAMEQNASAAAGNAGQEQVKVTAVQAEKDRRDAIIKTCKINSIDARVEARWIEDGTPLDKVIDELVLVYEERGKRKPMAAAALGLSGSETRNYSLFKALRAMRFGGNNPRLMQEAAFEIECSRAVAKQLNRGDTSNMLVPSEVLQRPLGKEWADQQRAMSAVPGSKGGYMVAVDNMGFIDILRNRSVAMNMGARVLSGLQGNVTFPRQTGKVTVTWQAGEGTSTNAADQALGQLSMTPKTCIAITDVSEQLLAQASPSAEAFVMADLANDVAIDGVDAATINGTGGAQPVGIKNTVGITSGQDASSATYAKILAFVSTAGALNAILGNPGFVTTTAGAARLMQVQRFTSTDTPLWTGNMLDGQCVGFKSMSSEQLASGNIVFGSWDQLVIGEWGVLELSTDNGGTRFNQAQVGIRAMWMVDVLVRYPTAFVVGTNLS